MTGVLQQRVQMQNFQIIQKIFIIWMHKYTHPHLNAWFPGKAFKMVLFNIKKLQMENLQLSVWLLEHWTD